MAPEITSKKRKVSKEAAGEEGGSPGTWNCSACTFANKAKDFKCAMCDTRKGTSTRKSLPNNSVMEQQRTMHNLVVQQQEKAVNSFRKRAQQSTSPTNSRHSPVSSCSSSQSLQKPVKASPRAMVPIPDVFIYRTSPKKYMVEALGEKATITEFRRKPITNDRVGPRNRPSCQTPPAK